MVVILVIVSIGVLIAATAVFEPEETNPAYRTAGDFVRAALSGMDSTALPLLDAETQAYVAANCPDASVSACVQAYIPPEWGEVQVVSFRRAAPDVEAWNVDWIASFAQDVGASGVCIYTRVENQGDNQWRIAGWAGFIHCGDPASRNMATNPDTPNRVP
jgi:hypothetical protein